MDDATIYPCRHNHPVEARYRDKDGGIRCRLCSIEAKRRHRAKYAHLPEKLRAAARAADRTYRERHRDEIRSRAREMWHLRRDAVNEAKRRSRMKKLIPAERFNGPDFTRPPLKRRPLPITLRCECSQEFHDPQDQLEHALSVHRRCPTDEERTPC